MATWEENATSRVGVWAAASWAVPRSIPDTTTDRKARRIRAPALIARAVSLETMAPILPERPGQVKLPGFPDRPGRRLRSPRSRDRCPERWRARDRGRSADCR